MPESELAITSAATATSPTAASAAATSMPAAATASSTVTSASTATAALLRTSFIHDQRPTEKILAVQRFDGFCGFGVVSNFSKTKTARLVREAIAQKRQRIRLHSNFGEERGDLFFSRFERQIPKIQFLHDRSPLGFGQRRNTTEKLKKQDLGRRRPSGNGPHPV